jgi:regulator of sigma E protease
MLTVLLVLGILIFLIVAHELGHFFAAKIFKVKVEEFGVGYPPRAFTLGTWGGTEYTLNWLPFGGFVRLFGEHGETHTKGSFAAAPKYAQALILIAGVITERGQLTDAQLFVNTVVAGSPAAAAGLRTGDEITRIQDVTSGVVVDLTPAQVVTFVSDRGGKPIELTYRREEAVSTVTLIPAHAVVEQSADRPAIGLGLVLVTDESLSYWQALKESGPRTWAALQDTVAGLWGLVRDAAAGEPNLKDIVGPVGLFDYVGNASRHGIGQVLALAGFISINLAVINLVPIPALDGGRLFLLGIETIIRRPPNKFAVQALNIFGVLLIVILMVTVTYNDIARLLS